MTHRWKVAVALVGALAGGCGGATGDSALPLPAVGPPPAGAEGSTLMTPELEAVVQAALADAARRTGMDLANLKLVSAEAVTWSDGSLGCAEPGMSYTQALVPGYRVIIKAGDETLDYHASHRGQLFVCQPQRAIDPLPTVRT